MKKALLKALSLILILTFIFKGCNESVPVKAPEELKEQSQSHKTESEEEVSLISDMLNESGSFKEPKTNKDIPYSYRIPEIMSDSPDAERINREIENTVLKTAKSALLDIRSKNSPKEKYIDYEATFKDDIVSIVIDGDIPQKYIYNFDFSKNKALSSSELLTALNIEEEDFTKSLKSSVLNLFDADEGVKEKAASLSKKNLSLQNVDVYLHDEALNAKVLVSKGGGNILNEYIMVNPLSENILKEVVCKNVSAKLEENRAEITFLEKDEQNMSSLLELNTPYEVEGLFDTYRDIYLFDDEHSENLALFLISDEGEITFCDIFSSAKCGNRFFAEDKIGGLKGVTALRQGEISGRKTVIASKENGEETDLYEHILSSRLFKTEEMTKDTLWLSDDGNYTLCFDEYNISLKSKDSELSSEGSFFFSGLTEKGYTFPFVLQGENESSGGFITIPYEMGQRQYQNIVLTFITEEKEASVTFFEYSKAALDIADCDVLCREWISADKKSSLSLANDRSAVFWAKDETKGQESIYKGSWRADDSSFSLSLEFSDGQPFEKNGHRLDYLDGSYSYMTGDESSLIIIPEKDAFPLAESQKIIKTFPEIFFIKSELNLSKKQEEAEQIEKLKKSAVEYAISQGIKANSADIAKKTAEGVLIRVYLSEDDNEKTKAWYMINPETKKGRNFLNQKTVELNSLI